MLRVYGFLRRGSATWGRGKSRYARSGGIWWSVNPRGTLFCNVDGVMEKGMILSPEHGVKIQRVEWSKSDVLRKSNVDGWFWCCVVALAALAPPWTHT